MSLVLLLIFATLGLAAIAFAAWPVLRRRETHAGRALLAGAIATFMLAVGGGLYFWIGQPQLALRTLEGPRADNLASLVAALSVRVRERPGDLKGWTLLGRGYLTLGDGDDAARAFAQAIAVSKAHHGDDAGLYSAYGEALTFASAGAVGSDAENAFQTALKIDPKDHAARYYLGLAYAARGQNEKALTLWQGLLADAPVSAPWRGELVDRIAALKAASGQAPDVAAMVAGLAQRLKANPNDSEGWQRLVRAYAVLGERDKAMDAIAQARAALGSDRRALAAIDAEAKSLGLRK